MLSFNETKMFNKNFSLHIKSKNSDLINELIKKQEIVNRIKDNYYEIYKIYKTELNDYLNKLSNS